MNSAAVMSRVYMSLRQPFCGGMYYVVQYLQVQGVVQYLQVQGVVQYLQVQGVVQYLVGV